MNLNNTTKSTIVFLAFGLLTLFAAAQTGTINNIMVQQRTDGSGMVDVYYTLNGSAASYNALIEASFDGGNTYTPVLNQYLSGDVSGISPGNRHIVWDGLGSFPNTFSTQAKVKILANEAGGWQPGNGVTDIDGNTYQTVIFGNQEWMAESLKTTKYRNGTPIEYPGTDNTAWDNNTTGAYAWYNNDIRWKDLYGALYNWHAVNNSNGLCPTGWHVPSHDEWTQLEQYICNQLGNTHCETQFPYDNTTTGWRGTNEGNALKSCRQISSPLGGDCATSTHPRWDSHSTQYGTDEFGFSAFPDGYRSTVGTYYLLGLYGYCWSSSEYSSPSAWLRHLNGSFGNVGRYYYGKGIGFSVRCVRD